MALKYQVSYQQVRTWTQRFEALGEEGLKDRRDKRKKDQQPARNWGRCTSSQKTAAIPISVRLTVWLSIRPVKPTKQKPWLCALLGQIPQPPNRFIISQKAA